MNRTPHIPNSGTSTLARAEYLRKQAADKALAERRTPQVELALAYEKRGHKPLKLADLAENDPKRTVFEDTLFAFKTAQVVKKDGKVVKGTVRVAAEQAVDKNKVLFEDPATVADALEASEWAQAALRWAGNQLFRKEEPKPAQATPKVVEAPAKESDDLGARIRAAGIKPGPRDGKH